MLIMTFNAIFLSLFFSGISIYFYIYQILSSKIINDNQIIISNLDQQISYYIESAQQYAKNIILDERIQFYLKNLKVKEKNYDYFSEIGEFENVLKEYLILRDYLIYDIFVIGKEENIISNEGYADIFQEGWYKQFLQKNEKSGFTQVHTAPLQPNSHTQTVISYMMNIYDKKNSDSYLGKLVIDVKYDVLVRMFTQQSGSIDSYYLFDEDYHVIYAGGSDMPELKKIFQNNKQRDVVFHKGQYYIIRTNPINHWSIVGVIPQKNIVDDLRYIGYVFLAIMIVCLLFISFLVYPILNNVTKPLMKLVAAMKAVSLGKMDMEVRVESKDEIEVLANVFNKMVKDIKRHLEESIIKEKKERELELQILMSQINPHFIYNTLNTIIYMARRNETVPIISLTKSFISILQYSIKRRQNNMETIANEIEYIKNYVSIFQYRYHNQIELDLDLDDSLLLHEIPHMILYPVIENSIFHGILPSSKKGRIHVHIAKKDETIRIRISDNGVGMTGETLKKVRELLNEDILEYSEHLGLRNVNTRLTLLYGNQSALNIESLSGQGTTITFCLPLQ